MSTFTEVKEIPLKYRQYRDKFALLFEKYDVTSIPKFIKLYSNNDAFKNASKVILADIARTEGGKVSLTTIGIIIGSALGGVGIAMMGGAIGVPLAAIFGISGFVAGSKVDSIGVFDSMKNVETKISEETYNRLQLTADNNNLSIEEFLAVIIENSVS